MSPKLPERALPASVFEGRCHCGAIRFELRTARAPAQWAVRACQCSFCRGHGARTTSDPEGSVRFSIPDKSKLIRYRFGSRSADFFVCRDCGVYMAAVIDSARGRFATLNVNVLSPPVDIPAATAISYEGESAGQRLARREQKWTPVIDLA
jgi:hypothetical protein